MGQEWTVNSSASLDNFIQKCRDQHEQYGYVTYTWKTGRQRSGLQNNALHKYCELLADELNERGLDMKLLLRHHVEIEWTKSSVKERLWKPIQIAMLDESSTTKPHRNEYPKIYDELNRYLIDKHGMHVPWPVKREPK